MHILHIDSSINLTSSTSRQLTAKIVEKLKQKHPNAKVTYRDLYKSPATYLSIEAAMAIRTGNTDGLSAAVKQEVAEIERSIEELMTCDAIVIGAPMYNLSVPASLKSWVDQVCQAGRTFAYTATGPKGLVKDKPTYLAISRGGMYSEEPMNSYDFQLPYLQSILGLLGITDIKAVIAEGVDISPEHKVQAISKAEQQINAL
ncbi:FMN-dependent NADH-azoreductase [Zophobihabitans entericus]|uniref:FMN dependent NADH:quinone oxidoreductase n=1 Tax=Zophobihabitans entericus TaxID=1635327 RepID=A0A6G9ICL2_9GAMM|nr:NAD(P)H-dependent oxidoreductase [Zophobihabitans entericus]QIQ21963.1 FMN-dependent NADH-azoreductase [Zophobihabitans entericus]